ncbi:MAG: hypothetical protein FWF29_00660 [Treponema sp.]|nr:hypothetical protein [Treponema sp.]
MDQFDIFITGISWGSGSKNRPVLALIIKNKSILVYPITTQYENKSEVIKARYFKLNDWRREGLDKQSYIDTGTLLRLPLSVISGRKPIGRLTMADKLRLLDFLTK